MALVSAKLKLSIEYVNKIHHRVGRNPSYFLVYLFFLSRPLWPNIAPLLPNSKIPTYLARSSLQLPRMGQSNDPKSSGVIRCPNHKKGDKILSDDKLIKRKFAIELTEKDLYANHIMVDSFRHLPGMSK